MNDERTQAIHKAATELVQELLGTITDPTPEKWTSIVIRKMAALPLTVVKPQVNPGSPTLRVGNYELSRLGSKVMVTRVFRDPGIQAGGDGLREVDQWEAKELARLKLWLNGE